MDFLCSRSELFRALDLDTGIKPLFIRPPEGFIEHFDKVLPFSTEWTDKIKRMNEEEKFDLVVIWPDNKDTYIEEVRSFSKRINTGGSLWMAITDGMDAPQEGGIINYMGILLDTTHILLCVDYDIYKVHLEK